MQLLLIANDQELHNRFEESGYFQVTAKGDVEGLQSFAINQQKAVVISDRNMSFNDLVANTETLKAYNHVFFMLSGAKKENEIISSICAAHGFRVIMPETPTKEIAKVIISSVFTNHQSLKNTFAFYGADYRVGNTSVAQSVAELLATTTNKKVLLLMLNDHLNNDFVSSKDNMSIDNIRGELSSRILDFKGLLSYTVTNEEIPNLHILLGPNDMLKLRHYGIDDIQYLLEKADKQNDWITIVDAGTHLDNSLTMGALTSIDTKFLVTTPYMSSQKSWKRKVNQVLTKVGIQPNDFMLILNKYMEDEFEEETKIAAKYDTTLATVIPYFDEYWKAEEERKAIYHYGRQMEDKALVVARIIASKVGAQVTLTEKQRDKGFIAKVFGGR